MSDDPIVDEIRRIRDEYAKQFDYDLDAICADLQQRQQQPGKNIVSFPPKRPRTARTPGEQAPPDAADDLTIPLGGDTSSA